MYDFNDRVLLLTGANGGIGLVVRIGDQSSANLILRQRHAMLGLPATECQIIPGLVAAHQKRAGRNTHKVHRDAGGQLDDQLCVSAQRFRTSEFVNQPHRDAVDRPNVRTSEHHVERSFGTDDAGESLRSATTR